MDTLGIFRHFMRQFFWLPIYLSAHKVLQKKDTLVYFKNKEFATKKFLFRIKIYDDIQNSWRAALSRPQTKERWEIKKDNTNATYKTTDTQWRTATEEPPWNCS